MQGRGRRRLGGGDACSSQDLHLSTPLPTSPHMTRGPTAPPLHAPEPVKAMPMMSRPARMAGVPCIWMGVGFLMPLVSSTRRMAGGNCGTEAAEVMVKAG